MNSAPQALEWDRASPLRQLTWVEALSSTIVHGRCLGRLGATTVVPRPAGSATCLHMKSRSRSEAAGSGAEHQRGLAVGA